MRRWFGRRRSAGGGASGARNVRCSADALRIERHDGAVERQQLLERRVERTLVWQTRGRLRATRIVFGSVMCARLLRREAIVRRFPRIAAGCSSVARRRRALQSSGRSHCARGLRPEANHCAALLVWLQLSGRQQLALRASIPVAALGPAAAVNAALRFPRFGSGRSANAASHSAGIHETRLELKAKKSF